MCSSEAARVTKHTKNWCRKQYKRLNSPSGWDNSKPTKNVEKCQINQYQAFHWTGAPNDSFLSDALKRYLRLSGVPIKLCRFVLGSAIIFLSVRSF